jgi:hypothetical protein
MTTQHETLGSQLQQLVAETPRDALPALVGELEAAKAVAYGRLFTQPPPEAQGQGGLLDAAQMAKRLGLPKSWLLEQARQGTVASVRCGHYVRFDPERVRETLARHRPRGSAPPPVVAPHTKAEPVHPKVRQLRPAANSAVPVAH